MAINNTKGLEALRALSEGGSAGLNAYKSAQSNEAASRTSALQTSLGTQDVGAAVADAQAKYSPKVPTSGLGVGDLSAAANSYLSRASNKLAAQNHEDQERLKFQTLQLNQAKQPSAADQSAMLLGASDAMAEEQRNKTNANPLIDLAGQKEALRAQLTHFDQANPFAAGTPASPELVAARDQQRGDILRQMAGIDEQYGAAANTYAGALGTDAQGLLQQYGTENKGNVQGLVDFLNPREEVARNQIAVGEQGRLRELAPAFGMDPLVAAGKFREGEGQELGRLGQQAKEREFVSGIPSTKEGRTAHAAGQLGLDPEEFTAYSKIPGLKEEEITQAVTGNRETFDSLNEATSQYAADQGYTVKDTKGKAVKVTGMEGYREMLGNLLADATNDDGSPLTPRQKENMRNMLMARNKTFINDNFGKGEGSD